MCPNLVSESAGKSSDPDIAVNFQQQASGGIAGGPSTEVRGIVAVGRQEEPRLISFITHATSNSYGRTWSFPIDTKTVVVDAPHGSVLRRRIGRCPDNACNSNCYHLLGLPVCHFFLFLSSYVQYVSTTYKQTGTRTYLQGFSSSRIFILSLHFTSLHF